MVVLLLPEQAGMRKYSDSVFGDSKLWMVRLALGVAGKKMLPV